MKKNAPKLKPVQKAEQWGNGLEAFRQRHDLSLRDLAGICTTSQFNISRDSIHRLCRGVSELRFIARARPQVKDQLRLWLSGKGKSESEIDLELRTIFCKEELEPVLTQRATLSREAQDFFGLRRDPFTGDPRDSSEVFTSPELDKALAQVMDAVDFQGFKALIGEVGAGKTIIKRRAVELCKKSNGKQQILWPEFFNMEKVHSGSISAFILRTFGQSSPHDLVARADKVKKLFIELAADGVRLALGFDECHRLDPRLLTALKNFWELGDGGFDRYVGLVLFGQPRLLLTLRDADFREIAERLDIIRVRSLGKHANGYLSHRLKIAGGQLERLFEPAALSRLAKIADTPLALGNLANAALISAFQFGERRVLAAHIPQPSGEPEVRGIRPSRNV